MTKWAWIVCVAAACGGAGDTPSDAPTDAPSDAKAAVGTCAAVAGSGAPPVVAASELALVTLEPQSVSPGVGHMFSVLFPADHEGSDTPLFVLFNGGPGVPTTDGLLTDSTAPNTVVSDADCHVSVVANPASFTALGSLLYLDARETGFSYDDGSAFVNGFNMSEDAIDFVRAILRVMDSHPQLTSKRVVLLGESYGGVRAQLILRDLLHYTEVPELSAEAQAHFDTVFGTESTHAPAEIAQQFFAQVLIEPSVMGAYQAIVPAMHGTGCYDARLSPPVCGPRVDDAFADTTLSDEMLGGRLEDVAGLSGSARHGVREPSNYYDGETKALQVALVQRLGALGSGDYYFGDGPTGDGAWAVDKTLVPPAFVDNLGYVRTLITHATYDGTLDTRAIPPALVAYGVPAHFEQCLPVGAARPGLVEVTLPGGGTTAFRMPSYAAGHNVSAEQALELRADIADWLGLPL